VFEVEAALEALRFSFLSLDRDGTEVRVELGARNYLP